MSEQNKSLRILSLITGVLFIAALIVLVGAGFYAGGFAASFGNNLCYSTAISHVSRQADFVLRSNDQALTASFQTTLANLPLRGYETSCSEILEKLKDADINQVSDNQHDYHQFVSAIGKFPYEASSERKSSILENYKTLQVGMHKDKVSALIGRPDFSQISFGPKGPEIHVHGSSWTYIFSKTSDLTNINDSTISIFFDRANRIVWAVPTAIQELREIGECCSPKR